MSRSVPEWIGKTPDSRPPEHVELRIFRREKGICHISGQKIEVGMCWQIEHKTALSLGGENRESNMFPALVEPHKAKSAKEAKIRSKADAVAKRHLGITRPKSSIPSRPKQARPAKDKLAIPERRPMFVKVQQP